MGDRLPRRVILRGVWNPCLRRDIHAPHVRSAPGGCQDCCPGVGYVLLRSRVIAEGGRSYPGCHDYPRIEEREYGLWREGHAPEYY